MRPRSVRLLVGAIVVTAFTSALSLFAAPSAHADNCYTVYYGSQAVTVCPWQ